MLQIIIQLTGGIGMFLLGMALMTDSLKSMAGERLRQWLGRFTGSPLKAMLSGIGFTLAVQSSTATTLATIGFVSAGVLSFAQAIGVIIGANIGTTSTGWMVALLGLKFSVASAALPMIGIGAMMKLLGKNHTALLGLSIAGFGLLFIGIDALQQAMAGFAAAVDLSQFTNDSMGTVLILILIGVVMTVLLQSSSAAITATLAALAGGVIDLQQALALVIGQNIGTVATALLAAIGATASAKRTVAVHVIFNVVTAVVAIFTLMPLILWMVNAGWLSSWDNVLLIALFHTCFSILGALIFMPFTSQFQALLERLIPEAAAVDSSTRFLDDSLFSMPAVAIGAAREALCVSVAQAFTEIAKRTEDSENINTQASVALLDDCLIKVDDYLEKMPVPQSQTDQEELMKLLQLMVYVRVIRDDLSNTKMMNVLHGHLDAAFVEQLSMHFTDLIGYLANLPKNGLARQFVDTFVAFASSMKVQKTDIRLAIIGTSADTQRHAADALTAITAQRMLDRIVKYTAKMVLLLAEKPAKVAHKMQDK